MSEKVDTGPADDGGGHARRVDAVHPFLAAGERVVRSAFARVRPWRWLLRQLGLRDRFRLLPVLTKGLPCSVVVTDRRVLVQLWDDAVLRPFRRPVSTAITTAWKGGILSIRFGDITWMDSWYRRSQYSQWIRFELRTRPWGTMRFTFHSVADGEAVIDALGAPEPRR